MQACSTAGLLHLQQYSGMTVFRNAFSRQQYVLALIFSLTIFSLTIFLLTFLKQPFYARGLV
jgi:hypothetical protein